MLEDVIKQKGYSLGFCQIGFTHAEPFKEYKQHINRLIKENKYPPFVSKDINLRSHPNLIMENCKSIISVAMSYKENVKLAIDNPPQDGEGYISPSAWGVDYHILVKDAMDELISFINEKTGNKHTFKRFVDTGHLSDREIAKRAGVGYVGKNSNIITPCSGSYIWLGHILTDLDLKPDAPQENLCGGCNLCIKSCPTGAINENGTIDYDKCLANVLVQKGELSEFVKEKMGKRVYGCDTCQLVCPKNQEVIRAPGYLSDELGWLPFNELENLSNKQFKRKYGQRAFSWRGKQVLLRNARSIKNSSK